ncbi:hypothetical protein D3C71_1757170 [compost metagenome]
MKRGSRLKSFGSLPTFCACSIRPGWKRESLIFNSASITLASVLPRRSAMPYSVITISRKCRGMVQWPYSQTILELTSPAASRQLRRIRIERAPSSAWPWATKLYCPPTPLNTRPSSS